MPRTVRHSLLLTCVALGFLVATAARAAAQGPQTFASTVTAIPATQTTTFTDVTLKGRSASEFVDRWIRLVTSANPSGFVTRVLAFDPATGQFTLLDPIPAATVSVNDPYLLGNLTSVPPAVLPANATDLADAIVNTGVITAQTTSVLSPVLAPPVPIPGSSLIWAALIKVDPEAKAIDGLAGTDTIINTGTASASATGVILPSVIPNTVLGLSKADVSSTAKATATGVDGGADADAITNTGTVTAAADAAAAGVSISLASVSESGPGKSVLQGNVTANAVSTGISGGDGDDTVTNRSTVDATATATSIAVGVAIVENNGSSAASAKATAEARAAAIEGGGGDDTIDNQAKITATAVSTADSLQVAIAVKQSPPPPTGTVLPVSATSSKSSLKTAATGGATARSRATGIGADALTTDTEIMPGFDADGVSATLSVTHSVTHASGNDDVHNDAEVVAQATSTTQALGVGVTIDGNASAKVNAKSAADAVAIDLGGGNDTLTNTGLLTATADATATSVDLSVSAKTAPTDPPPTTKPKVSVKSAIEGGATAESHATGISADSAVADSTTTLSLTIAEDPSVHVDATKIRASGDDVVTNSGIIGATATSTTTAAGIGLSIDGQASANATSKATAEAAGIDLGGGNDTVTNTATGQLTATANATANGLAIGIGLSTDPAVAKDVKAAVEGSVEAQSRAVGLSADSLVPDGVASATMTVGDTSITLTVDSTSTRASGNDVVTNDGTIDATATSISRAAGVSVAVNGEASAKLESKAEADAAGIDLGGGNDVVTNTGTVTATSDAAAQGLNVAVGVASSGSGSGSGSGSTPAPKVKTSVEAGATAEARATGLAADSTVGDTALDFDLFIDTTLGVGFRLLQTETRASGNDVVDNSGTIDAHATATTNAAGVGVTVNGSASAKSTSSTEATAAAIDLGASADTLTNTGTLTAQADSLSRALAVSVTNKGGATASEGLFKGGVESKATATGIDGAGGRNTSSLTQVLATDITGLDVRYEKVEDNVTADGADAIVNHGGITVGSTATSTALGVAVTAEGKAATITHVESKAESTGILGGNGNDTIANLGTAQMMVTADAQSNAGTVSFSGKGLSVAADALWSGGTKSEATATGINGDGGSIESTLVTAVVNSAGAQIVYEKKETNASGNDTIVNEQAIGVTATAFTPSIGVALQAGKGLAATVSAVETKASSTAVTGGGGNDAITNSGALTATADATSVAAAISIAAQGVAAATGSVWDGGTKAEATAIGIDADGGANTIQTTTLTVNGSGATIVHNKTSAGATGNDTVVNDGNITTTATADSNSLGVAITTKGLSAAASQSTATATADAIRGGAGNDTITNNGTLSSTATALAAALNVSVTTSGGVAIAGNGVWDGGTTAEATSVGINGDGGDGTTVSTTTIKTGGGDLIQRDKTEAEASGDDTITNTGQIDAIADAQTPQASVAVAVNGVGVSISTATAKANASAIAAGLGNDTVVNTGKLTADATALGAAVNVSVANAGVAIAANNVWDGGLKAEATSRGIDAGDGFDLVTNDAEVEARSSATTLAGTVAVAVSGVPVAVSTSTATSKATAIDGGDGFQADRIDNLNTGVAGHEGKLTTDAVAVAATANVAVTNAGVAIAADAVWDGGTKADATAKGIATGQGLDTVSNAGAIDATANAISGAAAVSVAVSGVAVATATSTATSKATAIDTGSEADTVTNSGALTARADALALAASVAVTTAGLAVGTDAFWNGGTTADARAVGIDAGAGADTVTNDGAIDAIARANTGSASVSVAVTGVAGALATSNAKSLAVAIDAGSDADVVTNTGTLTADSQAIAGTVNVAVTTAGAAVAGDSAWNGGTKAEATARTISAGDGADFIANDGEITATSNAITVSVPVSVAVAGVATAVGTSTSVARADAINGGNGDDTIVNNNTGSGRTGKLTSDATAHAGAATVSVTPAGVALATDAVWDGGTTADASARGIAAGLGNDWVSNQSEIGATSTARSLSAAVSVAVAGVAGASATSTAKSSATAIDAGGDPADSLMPNPADDDVVNNQGALTADAVALALSTPVTVTLAGVAVSAGAVWDGGTTAEAIARGIATGFGHDAIMNDGTIDVSADANTGSAAVSVAVAGVAAAIATSTSRATATAIDAGDGNNQVVNTGTLTADARALAGTVTVGVTPAGVSVAGDAAWNGGTTGDATSRAIATGDGADLVINDGELSALSSAGTASAAVSVAVAGVGAAIGTSTAISHSTAIDTGAGDDVVLNTTVPGTIRTGKLVSDATSNAAALTVTVTPFGVAVAADSVWDGGTKADATAAGIDTGVGSDLVINDSEIQALSTARTAAAAVSVNVFGVAGAIVNSTSTANATAIITGPDPQNDPMPLASDDDVVDNRGMLTASADALGVSTGIGFTVGGLSVAGNAAWDGGTSALAVGRGIATGRGADRIFNVGQITATSDANTVGVTGSIAVFGVAGALSTSTATARSTALDAGDGDDQIQNSGHVTADAEATGVTVNVALTAIGVSAVADALWNGGTQGQATATGIDGGNGRDTIVNDGTIDTLADATTSSVGVSVSVAGVGAAISSSTATADSTAIQGGQESDTLVNSGDLTATSKASATDVAVSVTGGGASVAGSSFWTGGTAANATSTGIAGGAGDDVILNSASTITADAASDTHSVAVAASLAGGFAGAAAASTSTARATAIDGGAGIDDIISDGALVSKANSTATGVTVTATFTGAAGSGSVIDNRTTAESIATGIAGGDDADRILANGLSSILLTSKAETTDTSVAVAIFGAAGADSQAHAIGRGTGIAGGGGDDSIDNFGIVSGQVDSESKARAISVSLGAGFGNTSGNAETNAAGLDGGDGNDAVTNHGQINLTSTATVRGQSVNVGIGSLVSDAGGTGRAQLFGIAGGAGDDSLVNNGTIVLVPTALGFGQNVSVGVAGSSIADASTLVEAFATGIDGGAGLDVLWNAGTIGAQAASTATARSTGVVVAGAGLGGVNSTASATAIGLDGGDDADLVFNTATGVVDAVATATAVANAVSITVFGATSGDAQTTPTATATGLEGGAGDDSVLNDGTVNATATATSQSSNSTVNIAGSASTSGGTTADASVAGLSGGLGNDFLLNRLFVTVGATSQATINGSSWTLAGAAGGASAVSATGRAVGMTGGSGDDFLRNNGNVAVTLGSTLNATGGSNAIFGGANSSTQLAARSAGFGLTGDDGIDAIENLSAITVSSTADVVSTKASVVFAGSPSSSALLVADARATGIDGGLDADRIVNLGTISIDASSTSTVNGGASSTAVGGAATSGLGTADATGVGIEGGAGANELRNTGLIDVTARGDAVVTNSSSSGWLFGNGDTRSEARSTVGASGLSVGSGDNLVFNDATLQVASRATGYGFAYASGAHVSFAGNGEALASSHAIATSTGIGAGDGANVLVNNGVMSVSSVATTVRQLTTSTNVCSQQVVTVQVQVGTDPNTGAPIYENQEQIVTTCQEQAVVLGFTPTYAGANGNGLAGDGTARGVGTAEARAYGIQAGDGNNAIANNSQLTVTASPEAKVTTFGDGDALGDARATSIVTSNATAVGIQAGNGFNDIVNTGTLTVLAEPLAQARAEATGGDICIFYLFGTWCGGGGSGIGTARATLDAHAVGIETGDGSSRIINHGTLSVTANPRTPAFTAGVFGADSATVSTTVTSSAIGIQTGSGNDQVTNTNQGVIAVEAHSPQICSGACSVTREAIGIRTGDGDDVIVNDGTISASLVSGAGAMSSGVAIDSGNGNDRVVIGVGSLTTGSVLLGAGDDRLVWSANAVLNGVNDGGPGFDTFALGGNIDATFQLATLGTFNTFERKTKEGPSTWTLAGNLRTDWDVEAGTLAIDGAIIGTIATTAGAQTAAIQVNSTGSITRDDGAAPAVAVHDNGRLHNLGAIGATTASGVAVRSLGQGSVIINDGLIGSTGIAVDMSGSGGLFTNNTNVFSTGMSPAVLVGGSGNTVSNSGLITDLGVFAPSAVWFNSAAGSSGFLVNETAGSISSVTGLAILGGDGSEFVTNEGTLTGGAGTALDLGNGADELAIVASSRINGVADGGAGIDTLVLAGDVDAAFDVASLGSAYRGFEQQRKEGSATWTLFGNGNAEMTIAQGALGIAGNIVGTISTSPGAFNPALLVHPGATLRRGDGGSVVILNGGAQMSNDGTVESTGSREPAVLLGGAGNWLVNTGLIAAPNGATAIYVSGDRNVIVNDGIVSGNPHAMTIAGDGNVVVNGGLLSAGGAALRFDTAPGFTSIVVNEAGATIESLDGLAIQGGAGAEQIDNRGRIVGGRGAAIDLAGGDDTLRLDTSARIGGTVGGGTGFDRLFLGGSGSVRLDMNTFTGFEALRKEGAGSWMLSGSSNMSWDVAAGQLVIDGGALTGAGFVRSGARLGGNGTVGGFVNAGTVAPGMSIGTINVLGDFEHATGGVLEIEGAIVTDVSDLLKVSGRAVLSGGTLQVLPETRPFGIATEYTFLQAAGGVSGTFASTTSSAAYLDTYLDYRPQSVTLTLVRNDVSFRSMGGDTQNLQALGASLDANKRSMVRGDFKGLMDQFLVMSEAEQRSALEGLSGEVHASGARTLLRTGERFFSASVDRQLSAQRVGDENMFWTDVVRFGGSVASDGNGNRTTYGAAGLVGGVDVMVKGDARVGAALGYSQGKTELDGFDVDAARNRSVMPALYGEYTPGAWSLGGGVGYARHTIRTVRGIQVGPTSRQANADYRADQYSGLARVGRALPAPRPLSLDAFGELRYSTLTRDQFDESGAASADLVEVGELNMASLRSLVGVTASWAPSVWGMRVEPQVRVAWAHESRDNQGELTAALSGTRTLAGFQRFTVLGAAEGRDAAVFSVGARTALIGRGSAFALYDGSVTETGAEHTFSAGLRLFW